MDKTESTIENSEYVVEISEYIEQLLTERPDKRKRKIYNDWYKEINGLAKKCNKLANFNIYGILK
jgi:hypothetical protein